MPDIFHNRRQAARETPRTTCPAQEDYISDYLLVVFLLLLFLIKSLVDCLSGGDFG